MRRALASPSLRPRSSAALLIVSGGLMLGFAFGWWLWLAPVPTTPVALPGATPAARVGPYPGDIAPEIRLPNLEGEVETLSEHRGHRVLLNFFASWCQPCRDEMPGVQAQAVKHAAHDWVVLGIDVMETREPVVAFRDEFGLTFPILLDESGRVTREYQIQGTPTNLTLDRDGVVVERSLGYMSEPDLEAMLARVP